MYQSELQESLKRLYGRSGHGCISSLVSGPWGIGKTISAKKVLREASVPGEPQAWYYLSVFGKAAIGDLLESLWLEVLKKNVKLKPSADLLYFVIAMPP